MAEVSNVQSATAKKSTARKAARKPAARKATVRKVAAKRVSVSKPVEMIDTMTDAVKEVVYAQLGVYGKVYDEVNSRVSQARKDAPKQWTNLVKRGERVQRDLTQAQKDLAKDLKKRVQKLDVKSEIEHRVDMVRNAMNKIKDRVKQAA